MKARLPLLKQILRNFTRGHDGLHYRVIHLGNATEIVSRDDHGHLREVTRITNCGSVCTTIQF